MARGNRADNEASTSKSHRKPQQSHGSTRNRASLSRLTKVYKHMSPQQKTLIEQYGFGGLLRIESPILPAALTKWIVNNFDPDSSEIIIPGRGRISVSADTVHRILGLPMGREKLIYDFSGSAINFINEVYGLGQGNAPSITSIVVRLKNSKQADTDYVRSWIMLAMSTFICPTIGLSISPKCYPSVVDMTKIKDFNWCQFVIDSLKSAAKKMSKRKSVRGCLFYLVILYLDSLEVNGVNIPNCTPRIAAWGKKLIESVIRMDSYADGTFGKLKFKSSCNYIIEESVMGQLQDIQRFVSSKVPANLSAQKKRKLADAVSKVCFGVTELMGNFITTVSKTMAEDDDSSDLEEGRNDRPKRPRRNVNENQGPINLNEDDDDDNDKEDSDYREDEEEELIGTSGSDGYDDDDVEDDHGSADGDGNSHEPTGTNPHIDQASLATHAPCHQFAQPTAIVVVPPEVRNSKEIPSSEQAPCDAKSRRQRLRLPTKDSAASEQSRGLVNKDKAQASRDDPLDFPVPDFDIMNEVDTVSPVMPAPAIGAGTSAAGTGTQQNIEDAWSFLDDLEADVLDQFEHDAVVKLQQIREGSGGKIAESTPGQCATNPNAAHSCPPTCTAGTPAFQPAPRRAARPAAALRSPYINYDKKPLFNCTKIVSAVYNAVCQATRRTTRSSQSSNEEDVVIIDFAGYYVSLSHLSKSVKPGGRLFNTVVEIGVYALNNFNARIPVKKILPLRVATNIQGQQLDNAEVKVAFKRDTNHLDRSQLVMFPVLQDIGVDQLNEASGHYFLIVLNLREQRFEVLDCMRSLDDVTLQTCCNNIISGIKQLWKKYYPKSKKDIENYNLIDIQVPQQSNNHDCGVHLLLHCEYWDGLKLPEFKEKDILNARKILTYKWINHRDNNVDWKRILHL